MRNSIDLITLVGDNKHMSDTTLEIHDVQIGSSSEIEENQNG